MLQLYNHNLFKYLDKFSVLFSSPNTIGTIGETGVSKPTILLKKIAFSKGFFINLLLLFIISKDFMLAAKTDWW